MDVVKFAEAVSWPIATIVASIVALLIVRMILTKSGKIGFSVKDWVSFEANASQQLADSSTAVPEDAGLHQIDPLSLVSETVVEPEQPTDILSEEAAESAGDDLNSPAHQLLFSDNLGAFKVFEASDETTETVISGRASMSDAKGNMGLRERLRN